MINQPFKILQLTLAAATLSLLNACGGGAGDEPASNNNEAATRAIAPFVGAWNLPDNWNNKENDEAYLLIKTPNADGEAEAIIYDLDDTEEGAEQNCFIRDGFPGTLSQSVTDELFLDVSVYTSAIAALTLNGDLEISVYSETAGSSAPPERVLIATRLDITENEITLCSS